MYLQHHEPFRNGAWKVVYWRSYGEHHLISSTLKCSKEGENNRKHEWGFFLCFSLLYIAFASVHAAFTLVPRVRESEAEMHLLVVGWRFSGVRRERGGGGSDRDMEGGGRVCPLQHIHSTVSVLNRPPPHHHTPHSSLTLFLFFQMQVTVKNVLVQYLHRSGAGTGR